MRGKVLALAALALLGPLAGSTRASNGLRLSLSTHSAYAPQRVRVSLQWPSYEGQAAIDLVASGPDYSATRQPLGPRTYSLNVPVVLRTPGPYLVVAVITNARGELLAEAKQQLELF